MQNKNKVSEVLPFRQIFAYRLQPQATLRSPAVMKIKPFRLTKLKKPA
jgi:hypothetical protein